MANYVKFRRGTPAQFVSLVHKDSDTLYFITEPNSLDGSLYLGSKLIAGGDDASFSMSMSSLTDVLLTELQDREFLVYDAQQKAWINATVDEVLGTFIGATSSSAGIAGLVPAPEKDLTDAFLRSDGKWARISASQNITVISNDTYKQHSEIMEAITSPVVDDILIIKDVIADDKYQHTAYVYDGNNWAAMDGNYSAENVYFKNDFIFTEPVGTVEIPESGNVTVAAAGKNIKEFLNSLFAQEENPMISQPKAIISLNNSTITYEVGSSYTPGYSIVVDGGSYSFGPDTGVYPIACTVTDSINNPVSYEWSKTYNPITVTDEMVYKVNSIISYSDGVIPVTNLGNPYPEGQIKAGVINVSSMNEVKGHRNMFTGTFNEKKEELFSNDIRTLKPSNANMYNGASFNVSIPVGAMRTVIAYPSHLRDLTSVKDVNALNADIVSSFKKFIINVEGFNGYEAIPYKVYVLDYAFGAATTNIYKVII